MPNFHETTSGEHTPDAALGDALLWLSRTPRGMADTILLTLPGRLHRVQEQSLFDECYRALNPDTGSMFLWGSIAGLLGSRFETQLVYGDLTHCWSGWERPALNPDVPLPSFGSMSREMPPSVTEWALRAAAGPGRLVIDVFPRAPHIAQTVGREIGCRVLSVAPVSDLYAAGPTAPAFVRDKFFADWFFKALEKSGKCLVWPGKANGAGYARLKVGGIEHYAHRVSWMLSHKRPIPEGMEVGHAGCVDKRCCYPEHLRLVSRIGNMDERWVGKRVEA